MRSIMAVAVVATLSSHSLNAQEITPDASSNVSEPPEEIVVIGERQTRTYDLADTLDVAPDSTALLRKAVGANVVTNGPISGIAQYRGMSRFRISSQINGAVISPGGPNWMDTPLSYAPAAHLESLEIHRGIAPVSAGQETIGGVINANTWAGDFSESGLEFDGRLRMGARSINDASLVSGTFVVADKRNRLKLSGLNESADDAQFSDGVVRPTNYERDRFDIGYGRRFDRHTVQFDYGFSNTGNAGTPALPMDIQWIDADLASVSHLYSGERWQSSARIYFSDIDHGMTNYHLRQTPGSDAMFRRNITDAKNAGFAFSIDVDNWKFGFDGHNEVHNSNISNPNSPMFFVTNFNESERRIVGMFAERKLIFADDWYARLGARYNHVKTDTQEVDATPVRMGMMPAVALRDAFNAADRSVSDDNFDWVAKLYHSLVSGVTAYAGLSRKSRTPSYQERYLWLPLQATGGLADGRTYTGNIGLKPEVAHEIELGLDWESKRSSLSPRLFYRDVSDYIQGTISTNTSAVMFVRMMNSMNSTNNADPLEFNNVNAKLYGLDLDWQYRLSDQLSVHSVLNVVRGKRDDIDDNLYRVAPQNAMVAVNYNTDRWGATLETFIYADQDDVSTTNNELPTAGYALLNLRGFWHVNDNLRFAFGVDNLFDKDYREHLAGINRVRGNPDLAMGERLPAYGRGMFARLDYAW